MKKLLLILVVLASLTASVAYAAVGRGVAGLPVRPVPVPPMLYSPWNVWGAGATEAEIQASVDGMVSQGLLAAGYNIIQITEWARGRDAHGNLNSSTSYVPSGQAALAAYIHAAGMKFGSYIGEGMISCANETGSYGHDYQDILSLASWGVDYYQMDVSCNLPPLPLTIYTAKMAFERLVRATNMANVAHGTSMLPVGGVNQGDTPVWAYGTGIPSVRVGPDMNPVAAWDTTSNAFEVVCVSCSLAGIPVASYFGPNHFPDLDALLVGNGLTDIEGQTAMSLWSIQASALTIGTDVRVGHLSAESLATLTNSDIIAVDQDALGITGARVSSTVCGSATCEVWAKPNTVHLSTLTYLT